MLFSTQAYVVLSQNTSTLPSQKFDVIYEQPFSIYRRWNYIFVSEYYFSVTKLTRWQKNIEIDKCSRFVFWCCNFPKYIFVM